MGDLEPIKRDELTSAQADARARLVTDYARATTQRRAPSTDAAYDDDLDHFAAWCHVQAEATGEDIQPLPTTPATLATYLQQLADAGAKLATIRRRAAGIAKAHTRTGYPNPRRTEDVRTVLHNLGRQLGPTDQGRPRQAKPVRLATLKVLLAALARLNGGRELVVVRDRAMFLLAWDCALRRSEVGRLQVADVLEDPEGLVVTIRSSKTDQEGHGDVIQVPYGQHKTTCPVRAYRAWLDASGIRDGAVFRGIDRWGNLRAKGISGQGYVDRLRHLAVLAGLDPAGFSGHSTRAGFITEAIRRRIPDQDVMRTSRHRSRTVFDGYVRVARPFADAASGKVGL
jgi:integrase